MIKARCWACFLLFTISFFVDCRGMGGGCRLASRVGRDSCGGRSCCGSGGSRRNRGCVLCGRCAMGGSREGGDCSRGRSSGCRWC